MFSPSKYFNRQNIIAYRFIEFEDPRDAEDAVRKLDGEVI
jgi:hypothetical protein